MARAAAASRRSAPNGRTRRTMPRQERKPCSGWGRRSRISSHSAAVAGADRSGFVANALDGPVGVTPVARRHVIGDGGVPMIAAGAQMRGDPLALEKDLDGARRQPDLDLATGKAVGDAVEVSLDVDMIIEADPSQPPFGEAIGL